MANIPAIMSSRILNRAFHLHQHHRYCGIGCKEFTTNASSLRSAGAIAGGGHRHLRRRHFENEKNDSGVKMRRCCIGDFAGRDFHILSGDDSHDSCGSDRRSGRGSTTTRQSRTMPTHNNYVGLVGRSLSTQPRNDNKANTQSSSIHPLPTQFLQDCDSKNFDPSTYQRNDVHFDTIDGKPPLPPQKRTTLRNKSAEEISSTQAEMTHNHPGGWIKSKAERWRANADDFDDYSSLNPESATTTLTSISKGKGAQLLTTASSPKRILWSNWTEDMILDPRTSPILFWYDDLIVGANECEERRLLKVLYQYGLVLIRGTPTYTDSLSMHDMRESTKEMRQRAMSSNNAEGDEKSAESAILHLASIIGYHPLHTLYGAGIWSTSSYSSFYNKNDGGKGDDKSSSSSAASTADSSYGTTSLPLHTDMTYISNPPGVQVFLMVQPAESPTSSNDDDDNKKEKTIVPKGQSVYLDGFAAARQLLLENPDAYRALASTPRRYRCIDSDLGWHLEATGPVIETIPSGGLDGWVGAPVQAIRHNDLDRLPDLPPYPSTNDTTLNTAKYDSFYHNLREAHEAWDDILRRDSMRFVIDLQAGDCVLVANQRCMHGRYAFETSKFPRVIMGCYIGMDELSSKWRKAGLRVF
ncbi:hypothetical protein ACHAXH_008950 [Discostella pseudostelligera]